jgi:hypothetical protein
MNSPAQPKRNAIRASQQGVFEFHNLEITRDEVVIHFFEEKTIIPLKDIAGMDLPSAKMCVRRIQKVMKRCFTMSMFPTSFST